MAVMSIRGVRNIYSERSRFKGRGTKEPFSVRDVMVPCSALWHSCPVRSHRRDAPLVIVLEVNPEVSEACVLSHVIETLFGFFC